MVLTPCIAFSWYQIRAVQLAILAPYIYIIFSLLKFCLLCVCACKHTCMRACVPACLHACLHACMCVLCMWCEGEETCTLCPMWRSQLWEVHTIFKYIGKNIKKVVTFKLEICVGSQTLSDNIFSPWIDGGQWCDKLIHSQKFHLISTRAQSHR